MNDTPGIRRAPAPCIQCAQPSQPGKERCATHQRQFNQQHAADRAYYHTPAWQRLRAACIARDYHQCVLCSGTRYLTAHHIVARKDGGPDTLANLVTVCHPCHGRIERADTDTTRQLHTYLQHSPAYRGHTDTTFNDAWGIG